VVSYQPLEVFLEKFHGIDEATLSRRHDQVDGVEIFLTIKQRARLVFGWVAVWKLCRLDIESEAEDLSGVAASPRSR